MDPFTHLYNKLIALLKLIFRIVLIVSAILIFLQLEIEYKQREDPGDPALTNNATVGSRRVQWAIKVSTKGGVDDDITKFGDLKQRSTPVAESNDDLRIDGPAAHASEDFEGLQVKGNFVAEDLWANQVHLPAETSQPSEDLGSTGILVFSEDLYEQDSSAYIGVFYDLKAKCPRKKDAFACHTNDEEHELFKERYKELEQHFDEFLQGYLAKVGLQDESVKSWLATAILKDTEASRAVSSTSKSINATESADLSLVGRVLRYFGQDLKPTESYELGMYSIFWTTWFLYCQLPSCVKRISHGVNRCRSLPMVLRQTAQNWKWNLLQLSVQARLQVTHLLVTVVTFPVSQVLGFYRASCEGVLEFFAGLRALDRWVLLSTLNDCPEFGALLAIIFAYDLLVLLSEWTGSQPIVLAFILPIFTLLVNATILSCLKWIFFGVSSHKEVDVTLVEGKEQEEEEETKHLALKPVPEEVAPRQTTVKVFKFPIRLAIEDTILRADLEIFRDNEDEDDDEAPIPWTYDPDDWENEVDEHPKPEINMSIPEPCNIAFRPFWTPYGHFALGVLVVHDFALDDPRWEDAIWYDAHFSERRYTIQMPGYEIDYESSFLEYFEVTLWPNTVGWDLFVEWGQNQGAKRDVRLMRPVWGSMDWGWTEGWEPFWFGPPEDEEDQDEEEEEEEEEPEPENEEEEALKFRFRPPKAPFDLWAPSAEEVSEDEEDGEDEERGWIEEVI